MTDLNICSAGIDVSKSKLDVAVYPGGAHTRVDYSAEGLKELDRFLERHGALRVGFEATGGYEWRLLLHLRQGAIPAGRFQPVQVKAFARSRLKRAKNDRLDALRDCQESCAGGHSGEKERLTWQSTRHSWTSFLLAAIHGNCLRRTVFWMI